MKIVYQVQESTHENDGLRPHVDVCETIEAAKLVADRRAGFFVNQAGEWEEHTVIKTIGEEWQPLLRVVPFIGFQHIFPSELHE